MATKNKTKASEFQKFEDTVAQILSVSHEELKERDDKWKRDKIDKRARRKLTDKKDKT